ncbi:MAG: hypothetical protein Q4P14_02510 [Methanobacteriaceae archaeon]|nr:hypothetical protein [Methanobacteriaceae archaeon]
MVERCPKCGFDSIQQLDAHTFKCHHCGLIIRNSSDLLIADEDKYGSDYLDF